MAAMAGGPKLLGDDIDLPQDGFVGTAPPRTFSGDETGDCNLLPRMAVGLLPNGDAVFAAVDGRNFERALGVTLAQLSALMRCLGCTVAMNLDGGSSKRLVVGQAVRDLPTTDIVGGAIQSAGVRPVRTALFGCHPKRYKVRRINQPIVDHVRATTVNPMVAAVQPGSPWRGRTVVSGSFTNQSSSSSLNQAASLPLKAMIGVGLGAGETGDRWTTSGGGGQAGRATVSCITGCIGTIVFPLFNQEGRGGASVKFVKISKCGSDRSRDHGSFHCVDSFDAFRLHQLSVYRVCFG